MRTYFVDVEDLAGTLPPVPDPSWLRRFGGTVGIVGRRLPYMLRLRRPRRTLPLTDPSAALDAGVES